MPKTSYYIIKKLLKYRRIIYKMQIKHERNLTEHQKISPRYHYIKHNARTTGTKLKHHSNNKHITNTKSRHHRRIIKISPRQNQHITNTSLRQNRDITKNIIKTSLKHRCDAIAISPRRYATSPRHQQDITDTRPYNRVLPETSKTTPPIPKQHETPHDKTETRPRHTKASP